MVHVTRRNGPTALPGGEAFDVYSTVYLNAQGHYVEPGADLDEMKDGAEVPVSALPAYFGRRIVLPRGVSDVFVWVHGWRNAGEQATASARRLFNGIQMLQARQAAVYPRLQRFVPAFLAVRWPSVSSPFPEGYRRIRDRAHALTEDGDAEFFLASLLGYLDRQNPAPPRTSRKILRAKAGFYLHCIGHSFGGRFLTAAIRAAASPRPRTLSLLGAAKPTVRKVLGSVSVARFEFTVDSLLVFQMAAPAASFGSQLDALVTSAPLTPPVVLTHSLHDRANCLWHSVAEGEAAIGCGGASQPAGKIGGIELRNADDPYARADYVRPIVNVDANWAYRNAGLKVEGAHSDIWYDESVHLVVSLAERVR